MKKYINLINYVIDMANSYSSPSCNQAFAWNYIAYALTRAYSDVNSGKLDSAKERIVSAAGSAKEFGVTITPSEYYFWEEEVTTKPVVIKALMPKPIRANRHAMATSETTAFVVVDSMPNCVISAVMEEVGDMTNCNRVFHRCQNGIDSVDYEALGIRSFSVGDIVSINDERFYQCEGVGWKQVYMSLVGEVYTLIDESQVSNPISSYPIPLV